ncbi:Thioesterase-like superfamily protein [Kytococcus aerolatus]|uniref:Thioesterase-like superfamily protein n=1 Tax=Kytococcus aerolatus TaxID=592308 RepID=A0A212T2X5_9MICO|nr:thioesterase family protein [Kytococcus aerolatus]SNC60397.1 Thioesterase-like superfamily protein [Kytococcus aerolatus]
MTALPEPAQIVADLPTDVEAYFVPLGEGRYQPTVHVQGAWRDWEHHLAPVVGLLTHEMLSHDPREDVQLSRITLEAYGVMPALPSQIEVRTVRPGRTIELLEATMTIADRVVVRAHAWRIAVADTAAVAGHEIEHLPAPDSLPAWDGMGVWSGAFLDTVEFREVPGHGPGRGRAWLRSTTPLLAGQEVSPTAQVLALSDVANGTGPRRDPSEWMFPNVEITLHLFRQPVNGWVGLDGQVAWGPTGAGLTSSWMHDEQGPFARIEQSLTVRPMPESL